MKNVNKTGYLKGGPTEDNDYNIIPGGDITMKNVEKNLIAIKLDKKGKPIGMEFMKPGKDYEFDNTYSVLEVPQYQGGGGNPFNNMVGFMSPNNIPNGINSSGNPMIPIEGSNLPIIPTDEELEIAELEGTIEELDQFSNQLEQENKITPEQIQKEQTQFDSIVNNAVDQNLQKSSNEELNELEPFKQSEFDNIQFFNPYGGVDIPTAATTLGQSISNKDTLGTVASSVKLATGLGRNIFGGIGAQKRSNQTMKDYYKKLREDGNVTSLQRGGSLAYVDNSELLNDIDSVIPKPITEPRLSAQQLADLNKASGVEFTADAANSIFEPYVEEKIVPVVRPELNLGRYKGLNYFNQSYNELTGEYDISPTKRNPANAAKYKDNLRYLQEQNPELKIRRNGSNTGFVPLIDREEFQKGGMKKEELLTGEFITGINEDDKLSKHTNANIEKGEYFATKEGDIAEVKGNKHSSGGENIIMEGGDRVLTDHTKLGASNAKMIRDKFDIQVKAKNTYADVLDKYRTKSGMSKLIKEEEAILRNIEDQKELEE